MKEIIYPVRLNKYLAHKGFCSRREADELIKNNKVYVNEKLAKLGMMIKETDVVSLHRGYIKKYLYIAYNKPKGVVTHSPQKDEIDIGDSLGRDDVSPIGRLDKNSEGLIILTNDGRITEKLLSPENKHEKEYVVSVDKTLSKNIVAKLERGVRIENYTTKPCKAKILSRKTLSITLTEGKRHQIRRMLASLGYITLRLKRVRIANIKIAGLVPNEERELKGKELSLFLEEMGLK